MSTSGCWRLGVLALITGAMLTSDSVSLLASDEEPPASQRQRKREDRLKKREAAKAESKNNAGAMPIAISPAVSSGDRKILRALEESTVMAFVETPLADVVDSLKDYHKIEIQIDKAALDDAGIGTDTPITRNLRGITLRSALTIMLREYDCTFVVAHETLIITTEDVAEARQEVRIYDVSSLIRDSSTKELADAVWQIVIPPAAQRGQPSEPPPWLHKEGIPPPTGEGGLAGVRRGGFTTASPAAVVPLGRLLIVRHSQLGHDEVAQFLLHLHKAMHASQ